MKKLALTIAKEPATADRCAVYNLELERAWPRNGEERRKAISAFAESRGWLLRHYKDGFVAMFTKEPPSKRN